MSSLLVSGVVKPWQKRALEGLAVAASGFGPVHFAWKGRFLLEQAGAYSSGLGLAGAYSRGHWAVAQRALGPVGFRWKGRHFWSRG